jgi:DNA-binding MarR family transcriptional regulator
MVDAHPDQPPGEGGLTELEANAWSVLLKAHAALVRGLDADLRAAHGLPLADFEILTLLNRESCQPLRMAALADSSLLSPSGLSRAIERLEVRKLVRRDRCPEDRRGTLAQLTEFGAALLATAGSTHTQAIRERYLRRLTLEQLQVLSDALQSVLAEESTACSPAPLHIDVNVLNETKAAQSESARRTKGKAGNV